MSSVPSTSGQQALSHTLNWKQKQDAIDLISLPSFMLTEDEIKQQIAILEPNLKEYKRQLKLITNKLQEHKGSLEQSTFLKNLEYFKSNTDEPDEDREEYSDDYRRDEIMLITTLDYPIVTRYFKHWIGRETNIGTDLLKKLEECLSRIEEDIDSGQLCKDSIQRKAHYVKLAVVLHKIHAKCKSKHAGSAVSGSLRTRRSSLSKDYKCRHINECECSAKGPTLLSVDNKFDLMDDMVTLGSILLQMCYPTDALQQSDEHIYNLRTKILRKQTIDSDEFIAEDIYLITMLIGCSKGYPFGLVYSKGEMASLRQSYSQLTDKGKQSLIAVARIFDISLGRLLRHCGNSIKNVKIRPTPENQEINLICDL